MPIPRWIVVIVGITCLQDSFGANFTHNTTITNTYVPGSIAGKYKYGTIDTGFFYSNWLANTLYNFYGNDANVVRESLVPSTMVDFDGKLYTIDLWGLDSYYGLEFLLKKYTASDDGSNISSISSLYYPWKRLSDTLGTSPNAGTTPELYAAGWNDGDGFEKRFHNCLQPCIVQDVVNCSYDTLLVFLRTPPGRYYRVSNDIKNEGILYLAFYKSSLVEMHNPVMNYNSNENVYWYGWGRWRRKEDSYQYAMEKGNYAAWKYWEKVHLEFIARHSNGQASNDPYYDHLYHQYNDEWGGRTSLNTVFAAYGVMSIGLCKRYIYDDGYVYALYSEGYHTSLYRSGVSDSVPSVLLGTDAGTSYLETTNWGHTEAPYDYDFFIETGNNDKKIFVYLSFAGGGSYSPYNASCNWSSTYCNWTINYATLLLQSWEIPDTYKDLFRDSSTGHWVQNVIYITPYTRTSGNFVDVRNTSKGQVYRLYQNTHRMVRYVSSTGTKYVIYCYCYPGKEPQL